MDQTSITKSGPYYIHIKRMTFLPMATSKGEVVTVIQRVLDYVKIKHGQTISSIFVIFFKIVFQIKQ